MNNYRKMEDDESTFSTGPSKWGAIGEPVPRMTAAERASIDDLEFQDYGESSEDYRYSFGSFYMLIATRENTVKCWRYTVVSRNHHPARGPVKRISSYWEPATSGVSYPVASWQSLKLAPSRIEMPNFDGENAKTSCWESTAASSSGASYPAASRQARDVWPPNIMKPDFAKTSCWESTAASSSGASYPAASRQVPNVWPTNIMKPDVDDENAGTRGDRKSAQASSDEAYCEYSLPQQSIADAIFGAPKHSKIDTLDTRSINVKMGMYRASDISQQKNNLLPQQSASVLQNFARSPMQIAIANANEFRSARNRQRPRDEWSEQMECSFCKQNGEQPFYYRGHTLKDVNGFCSCPVLLKTNCTYCKDTGRDTSHTITYCPQFRQQGLVRRYGLRQQNVDQ